MKVKIEDIKITIGIFKILEINFNYSNWVFDIIHKINEEIYIDLYSIILVVKMLDKVNVDSNRLGMFEKGVENDKKVIGFEEDITSY